MRANFTDKKRYWLGILLLSLCLIVSGLNAATFRYEEDYYLVRASKKKDPDAFFYLGTFYYAGDKSRSIKKDYGKSFTYYSKGAELGDFDCIVGKALCLMNGQGTKKDKEAGMALMRKAARVGHPLGLMSYATSFMSPEDKKSTIKAAALLELAHSRMKLMAPIFGKECNSLRKVILETLSKRELKRLKAEVTKFRKNIPVFVTRFNQISLPIGPPAFDKNEAAQIIEKVVPHVESVTGKKFKQIPELVYSDRTKVAISLSKDLTAQFKNLQENSDENANFELADNIAIKASYTLFGKYGLKDKKLYIMPRNIVPLMKRVGIPLSMVKPLVEIVIAHELVHALQDQHANITKKVFSAKSQDSMVALNAVMEGHAVFMQESVGTSMGYDKEIIEFSNIFSTSQTGKGSEKRNLLNMETSVSSLAYVLGKKFIDYIVSTFGRKYLWKVLQNPPKSSAMVANPESYSSKNDETLPLAKIFENLDPLISPKKLITNKQEIGILNFNAMYPGMNPQKKLAMIKSAKQAFIYTFKEKDKPGNNSITLFLLKTEGDCWDFLDALQNMAKRNIEVFQKSPQLAIKDIKFTTLPDQSADRTQLIGFSLGSSKHNKFVTIRVYRLIFKNFIIEFSDTTIGLSIPKVIEIAKEIHKRFKAIQKATKGDSNSDKLLKKAINFYKKRRFKETIQILKQILVKDPNHAQTRLLAAVVSAKKKNFKQAWAHIEIAQEQEPKNPKILQFIKRLNRFHPKR